MGLVRGFGGFRLIGAVASLASLAGMGLRFAMVLDHQGTRALQHCASQAAPNVAAAAKAARCIGTATVAIWTRRAGQLIQAGTVGR